MMILRVPTMPLVDLNNMSICLDSCLRILDGTAIYYEDSDHVPHVFAIPLTKGVLEMSDLLFPCATSERMM